MGKHVPYFVGKKLHFAARVETLKSPLDNELFWSLHHSGSSVASDALLFAYSSGQIRTIIFELPQLSESGEYVIRAGLNVGGTQPLVYSCFED